jgi:hypothetical protein
MFMAKTAGSDLSSTQEATKDLIGSYLAERLDASKLALGGVEIRENISKTEIGQLKANLRKTQEESLTAVLANPNPASFENYIKHSTVIAEFERGVVVTTERPGIESLGSSQRSPVKIRDCRFQKKIAGTDLRRPSEIKENWQVLIANHAKAAVSLIELSDKTDDEKIALKKQVMESFKEAIVSTKAKPAEKDLDRTCTSLNSSLVSVIKDSNLTIDGKPVGRNAEEIGKAIALSRDYGNLQDAVHEHVVTISGNLTSDAENPVYNVNAAVRVNPLSTEIRADYEAIKAGENTPQWYQDLKPLEQRLIRANVDSILAGKTISSQLKNLPGLKNAYVEVRGNTEDGHLSETTPELRTGAVAQFNNKRNNRALTERNVAHLQKLADDKLHISVLNSNNAIGIGEAPICNLTEQAAKTKGASYQNTPLSGMLTFGRIVATIPLAIISAPVALVAPKLSKRIREAALHYGKDSRLEASSKALEGKVRAIMCKSGKDRTGMQASANNIKNSVLKLFGSYKGNDKKQKETFAAKQIVDAAHAEALAGGHGATIGITELKSNSVFAGMSSHVLKTFKKQLKGNKLSKHNHFKQEKKSTLEKIKDFFKTPTKTTNKDYSAVPTREPVEQNRGSVASSKTQNTAVVHSQASEHLVDAVKHPKTQGNSRSQSVDSLPNPHRKRSSGLSR